MTVHPGARVSSCSFEWLRSDFCLKNDVRCNASLTRALVPSRGFMPGLCLYSEAYTVYRAFVPSRIVAYRTRHTQCVGSLFLRVAYAGSLLKERGIHSVQRALVPSRGLCWIFALVN